jgi:hypothetical protein
MKHVPYLLLAAVLSACRGEMPSQSSGTHGTGAAIELTKSSDRLLIKEEVLGDLGLSSRGPITETNITVFLIVPDKEQGYFVNRYNAWGPALKLQVEGSERADYAMRGGTVIDKASGKPAVVYNVSVISLKPPNAKASGGFFYGSLGGTTYLYDLLLERGKWRIVKKEVSITF